MQFGIYFSADIVTRQRSRSKIVAKLGKERSLTECVLFPHARDRGGLAHTATDSLRLGSPVMKDVRRRDQTPLENRSPRSSFEYVGRHHSDRQEFDLGRLAGLVPRRCTKTVAFRQSHRSDDSLTKQDPNRTCPPAGAAISRRAWLSCRSRADSVKSVGCRDAANCRLARKARHVRVRPAFCRKPH